MRIALFSDGTGNAASSIWRTNVWRTFESADLSNETQMAIYDDGVGTSSFKPLAILGGAFGWGLKRNVIDIYKFLCRNYSSPADEIFAFGFSRGAFTMRIVMGLAMNQGLVCFANESELDAQARAAYRAYRAERFHTIFKVERLFRPIRDVILKYIYPRTHYETSRNRRLESVRFLGLWDTVAAYGLPVDEMTRGVSRFLWPLELPDHSLDNRVKRACHALSLDDERTTFHPELWDETGEKRLPAANQKTKDERISQVWFAGVHSNVGGGYPDDSLAYVPLYWIMKEAQACGLCFKTAPGSEPDTILHAASARDKDGRLYDSRSGVGSYYRYGPRKLQDLCQPAFSLSKREQVWIDVPKIHESVIKRIQVGAHNYAPIGIPGNYNVVLDDGTIVPLGTKTYETPQDAKKRANRQEFIWNLVWLKRLTYFLTVAATIYLLVYPFFWRPAPEEETASRLRPIADLIRLAGSFVPGWGQSWVHRYAETPARFLFAVFVVGLLTWLGLHLAAQIKDGMRTLWLKRGSGPELPQGELYRMRTSRPYQLLIRSTKYYIAPAFFALFFLYIGLVLTSHVAFNFADAFGFTCKPTKESALKILQPGEPRTFELETSNLCYATGYAIKIDPEKSNLYRIEVSTADAWTRFNNQVSVRGYTIGNVQGAWDILSTALMAPLRRDWFRPWHRVLLRTGLTGTEEIFLDPDLKSDASPAAHTETDHLHNNGEVFLYLNDAVIALPWISDYFYRSNTGKVKVTVTLLGKPKRLTSD